MQQERPRINITRHTDHGRGGGGEEVGQQFMGQGKGQVNSSWSGGGGGQEFMIWEKGRSTVHNGGGGWWFQSKVDRRRSCGQANTCENITFPRATYMVGKNYKTYMSACPF